MNLPYLAFWMVICLVFFSRCFIKAGREAEAAALTWAVNQGLCAELCSKDGVCRALGLLGTHWGLKSDFSEQCWSTHAVLDWLHLCSCASQRKQMWLETCRNMIYPTNSFRQEEQLELCHGAVAWIEVFLRDSGWLPGFCALLEPFCLSEAGGLCSACWRRAGSVGKKLSWNQIFGFSLGLGQSKLLRFSWDLVLADLCSLVIVPLIWCPSALCCKFLS